MVAAASSVIETLLALTCTLPGLRIVRPLISSPQSGVAGVIRRIAAWFVASAITAVQTIPIVAGAFVGGLHLYFVLVPDARDGFDPEKFFTSEDPGPTIVRTAILSVIIICS